MNGIRWKNEFLKSEILGVPRYGVLPDCRVFIVGRQGLQFRVVIDDVPWENSVYNSDFLMSSKDGKKVLQLDAKGTVIVNDVMWTHTFSTNIVSTQ